MPRLQNTGPEIDAYCKANDCPNTFYDLCSDCAQDGHGELLADLDQEYTEYGEPLGILGDEFEHPDYDDCEYTCDFCKKPLTGEDD